MSMDLAIFEAGVKLDIRKIDYNENEAPQPAYRSQVYDTISNGTIKIEMPTMQGKLVLLQLESIYSLVFFGEKAMYECHGKVINRYKTNNMFIAEVEIVSQPKKIQRREYYRMECMIDAKLSRITQEEQNLSDLDEIIQFRKLKPQQEFGCTIVDISGGGVRLVCDETMELDAEVLLEFNTIADGLVQVYQLRGRLLKVSPSQNNGEKYELRVEFTDIQPKIRERLIRFIFETERRKIRNEKG